VENTLLNFISCDELTQLKVVTMVAYSVKGLIKGSESLLTIKNKIGWCMPIESRRSLELTVSE